VHRSSARGTCLGQQPQWTFTIKSRQL
jgi:hypothetical protein